MFNSVFTTYRHLSQFLVLLVQSTFYHDVSPSTIYFKVISFHQISQPKLCMYLLPCVCNMIRPSHPAWFDRPNNIDSEQQWHVVVKFKIAAVKGTFVCVCVLVWETVWVSDWRNLQTRTVGIGQVDVAVAGWRSNLSPLCVLAPDRTDD